MGGLPAVGTCCWLQQLIRLYIRDQATCLARRQGASYCYVDCEYDMETRAARSTLFTDTVQCGEHLILCQTCLSKSAWHLPHVFVDADLRMQKRMHST